MKLTRRDFQRLARARVKEARLLFLAKCYDGSYYLAGLAVECALKACIAKRTKRHDFPEKETVLDSYTHDLGRLLNAADLRLALERDLRVEPVLAVNWSTVQEWSIESRYYFLSRNEAGRMYEAVTERSTGVLSWFRRHW